MKILFLSFYKEGNWGSDKCNTSFNAYVVDYGLITSMVKGISLNAHLKKKDKQIPGP